MVLDAVSNFVRGTADAAVGTSDTTVSVADASIFPDPETDGEFNVVIWDVNNFPRPDQDGDVEIMRVTARDTTADELTVTRSQEMTSAAAHPEGSAIHLSPTAKMFSDIESTFGDFWDAGTQELTADVNNTNTTTQALEADEASRGNGNLWDQGTGWASVGAASRGELDDITSTTYVSFADIGTTISGRQIPNGASLYGLMWGRVDDLDDGETAFFRPQFLSRDGSSSNFDDIDELEYEFEAGDDSRFDTGWVEITSVDPKNHNFVIGRRINARVSGGTMMPQDAIGAWGLALEWRVD